jgi:hypothetical protein
MRGYLKRSESVKKKLKSISRKERRGGGGRFQPRVNRMQLEAGNVDEHGRLLIFPCVQNNYHDMRYCSAYQMADYALENRRSKAKIDTRARRKSKFYNEVQSAC